jgi:NAD(P)H-hydrate repair Nnr-like enzyme with NAD(P)H-hydrate dehydratase domain
LNFKLFVKGERDLIVGDDHSFIVRTPGSLKRCGGIGDILSGTVAVCSLWNYSLGPALASIIVRTASKLAYENEGRSLTAPGVIK